MNDNFSDILKRFTEPIESHINLQERINSIFEEAKGIDLDLFDTLLNIKIPKLEISKPKKYCIDFLIKSGWTVPHHVFWPLMSDDRILRKSQSEIDEHIAEIYLEDDMELYKETKDLIIDYIYPKHKKLVTDCFFLFEKDKFSITIPALLSIIEGEITEASGFENSIDFKNKIKRHFNYDEERDTSVENIKDITKYSLVSFLVDVLYCGESQWENNGCKIINRHQVMHGRDTPDNWDQIDFLRLMHTLATITMIKE